MVGFAQEQDINVDRYGSIVSLSEFLSKIGTHLLASSDIIEKNRNPLACLRNAGSHSAESYCSPKTAYTDISDRK